MSLTTRILLRWLQLAGATGACALLVYLAVHQMWRADANDPQIQLARETALELALGQPPSSVVARAIPVDFAQSVAPFLTVLDAQGGIVASSGRLHGQLRTVPAGVLDHVRASGEEHVSWQPESGVRIASVVVRYPSGFVVAGRSLALSEDRTAEFGQLLLLAWLASLVGLAILVTATEALLGAQR